MDIHVLRWKVEEASVVVRQFLIRRHRSTDKNSLLPEDRTVSVWNIPPYLHEASLSSTFSKFGMIQSVYFQKNPKDTEDKSEFFREIDNRPLDTYKTAYIIFRSGKSVEKVIGYCSSVDDPVILSTPEVPIESGLPAWIKERRKPLPSRQDLAAEIDTYMKKFDARVVEDKEKAKTNEGLPDEEGWVTVTRVGKKRGVRQVDVMNEATRAATKKKASEKELLNFYKFQKGEGKTGQLAELRRKFEEDKQKVAQMKAARKFKPY